MEKRNPSAGKFAKNPMRTLKQLIRCSFARYKLKTFFVVIFVILSSAANIVSVSRLGREIVPQLFGAANRSGAFERLCGGNDGWAKGHQDLLP